MSESEILWLSIYVVLGFLVGLLVDKLIMPLITKLAAKTKIKSDDLIITTIRKWIIPWSLALGIYLGLRQLDIDLKFFSWIENGLIIFYIFSATLIAARVISGIMSIKASGSDSVTHSSSIIGNIIKAVIYIIGLLIILQSQGISVTPMLTALGVGGLAVALALQTTLANLFAGLQIIATGKINQGDFIKLASGDDGYVEDVTWRSTTLRAASDHIIIVPNAKLADMIVSNYYLPFQALTFNVEFGVSYDSDLNHVEAITIQVVKEILDEEDTAVKDFEPFVRFVAFGDSSINMKAFLRVQDYSSQFLVKSLFIKRLHQRFIEEGINIPFPIRTVIMQKEQE